MERLETGDRVDCTYGGTRLNGTYITDRDGKAVIKLDSGYNIGVGRETCRFMERPVPARRPEIATVQDDSLPPLSIISTGGTIASRIDYRTGAVTSQFDADDILRAIPGLSGIARYRTTQLYTILSENMTPAIWQELATAVYKEINDGATGVIVTHGTDTMEETAYFLQLVVKSAKPVVLTGSMRPSTALTVAVISAVMPGKVGARWRIDTSMPTESSLASACSRIRSRQVCSISCTRRGVA
jgi:glutamyl-tRNA(Gln) amidotransferase subunit D